MQVTTLKDPGINILAQTVRREVARVISNLETSAPSVSAGLFANFLSHAATVTPGYTGPSLPTTQVVVANGGTVNVENSAGNLDSPATATVAAGVLSSVKLASTKTILTSALKFSGVTITGTGTFFTPTIVNGVLTGGVLSAS
jgi:hypothetical protein